MRAEIEASRALVFETGLWVDRLKAYQHLQAQGDKSIPDLRKKIKEASSLADALTPMIKYYASEMGNRVCYLAMQIHGGVGYMREFNVERLCRDVRVTNIYEGTSQMQVVAMTGKLLGHALDDLIENWEDLNYGPSLEGFKNQLIETTNLFKQATDALKGKDRDLIDFYASDLADMASFVVISWLLLRDALVSERKADIARVYISEHITKINALGTSILKADETALKARETVLAEQF